MHYGPAFSGDLEHWHYDTFCVTWRDPLLGKGLITFTLDAEAKVDGLKIAVEGQTPLEFKHAPEKSPGLSMSEAELSKFVGKFESKEPPLEVRVELVDGRVKSMTIEQGPGGSYTLMPKQ